jgi:hypothetical protein
MHDDTAHNATEARRDERLGLDGDVTVRFDAGTLFGSGQNISLQGIFFTALGSLPVTVHVAGRGDVRGHLVRVESLGDGRFGIAVRFDDEQPGLVPGA